MRVRASLLEILHFSNCKEKEITLILGSKKSVIFVWNLRKKFIPLPPRCRTALDNHGSLG